MEGKHYRTFTLVNMTRWIFLRNSDNLPGRRPRTRKQFEVYEDGFDPNRSNKFGPTEEYRFVPIAVMPDPAYNAITEYVVPYTTVGFNGETFPGHLVANEWRVEKQVVSESLANVKRNQYSRASADLNTRLVQGYVQSNRTLDLDQGGFSILSNLYAWVSVEIALGNMTGSDTITFNDRDDKIITVTAVQLRETISAYGQLFNALNEEDARVRRAIKAATTPAEVLAVTWNFNL